MPLPRKESGRSNILVGNVPCRTSSRLQEDGKIHITIVPPEFCQCSILGPCCEIIPLDPNLHMVSIWGGESRIEEQATEFWLCLTKSEKGEASQLRIKGKETKETIIKVKVYS